jgi:hypothetical protein
MRVLLVNWTEGENNPFDFFNAHLKREFESLGCIVSIIQFDSNFISTINGVLHQKFDLAITWQGLGSNIITDDGVNLWEKIQIPLVCLHGDHPCHMPLNHSADNIYIHHIYGVPSFAKYSNTYFKRSKPAIFYMLPNFFRYKNTGLVREGDFFVFPKNLDPVPETLDKWLKTFNTVTSTFLIEAAQSIMCDYDANINKDHHLKINELLTNDTFDRIKVSNNISDEVALFHYLHALLDKIYRNYASEQIVKALTNHPLRIVGRGWDSFKQKQGVRHQFYEINSAADGDWQFYSNYGIIDIAPAVDSLHDRFFRALAHQGGVISNSLISNTSLLGGEFTSIFYRMNAENLTNLADQIIKRPEAHLEQSQKLSEQYNQKYNFFEFYTFLTQLI